MAGTRAEGSSLHPPSSLSHLREKKENTFCENPRLEEADNYVIPCYQSHMMKEQIFICKRFYRIPTATFLLGPQADMHEQIVIIKNGGFSLWGRRLGPGPYDGSKALLSLPTLSCSPAAFNVGNSS